MNRVNSNKIALAVVLFEHVLPIRHWTIEQPCIDRKYKSVFLKEKKKKKKPANYDV